MLLGSLLLAMLIGAIAASYWIVAGGSFLVAFALYSGVATLIVLAAAVTAYIWSEMQSRAPDDTPQFEAAE